MKYLFRPILLLCILLFSLFSLNVAFAQTHPNLFLSTPPKQIQVGERVSVDIKVQSNAQAINAISGVLAFPDNLVRVASISKDKSVIDIWTREPKVARNKISFEGIVFNPGFQGSSAQVFRVTFEAKKSGFVTLNFSEGAVLANDGLGTNILATLSSTNFKIVEGQSFNQYQTIALEPGSKLAILPVITEYSPTVDPTSAAYLKGKGEPNALTKIVFKDISLKSVGERFIELLQTKKKKLDEVLVKNDDLGAFQYISGMNLTAGVYNATPFLVDSDTNTEKPGLGVQLLVSDSKLVKALVVVINILALLIPIVGLIVIIYFIPWYSWRRMRVLKKKLGLEEEKLVMSGHQLERQDKVMDKTVDKLVTPDQQ